MLPVLMYHGLHSDDRSGPRLDPVYSVHARRFAEQLDWLQAQGYRTLRLGERAEDGKGILITFDDGDLSNAETALPLLHDRGMHAAFFITSDFIGQPGMLAEADVLTLLRAGMEIGAHGRSHAYLEDLEPAALDAELSQSRQRLEAITGHRVDALALPGGRGGERERVAAISHSYVHLLGSAPGVNSRVRERQWMQRIPVTRDMSLETFEALVRWRGLKPRLMRARHLALTAGKRVLGNTRYERLRARLL